MAVNTAPRPRRADAQRNIDAILDAAIQTLGEMPDASMADIAAAAGVGRVTVYAHFASRADLVRAVVERAIREGDAALSGIDLSGDARVALARLIDSSWLQIAQIGSVAAAASALLDPDELRRMHEVPAARVQALVRRGRDEGTFRSDLPETWLVSVLHMIMQGAALEVAAGRLAPEDTADTISATVLAAYAPPSH